MDQIPKKHHSPKFLKARSCKGHGFIKYIKCNLRGIGGVRLVYIFKIIFFEPNEKVSESIDLENIHLAKIGVILDMDNGLICFLNPDSNNEIVSFPKSQKNGANRNR